jgi:hypothetical protein
MVGRHHFLMVDKMTGSASSPSVTTAILCLASTVTPSAFGGRSEKHFKIPAWCLQNCPCLPASHVQIPTEMSTSYFSSLFSLGTKYVNAVTLVILSVFFKRACKRSLGAWGERIAYGPGQVRFQLKILKPILPFLFIFYRGSNHNFRTTTFYLLNNFFDISFHFIFHCSLLSFLTANTYNQRSVVSALLATTTRYAMTASRDYVKSTLCLRLFLVYASRLLLRHSSASHCRMHVWNGNMLPGGVIGVFHWRNPSDRTMALGSIQRLTKMSTRNIS